MKKACSAPIAQTPSAPSKHAVAARRNGSFGGQERAARYGREVLSEWASCGVKAALAKFNWAYFKKLRKRRKHYPKYSQPVAQPSPRMLAAKKNAEKGGNARAEQHDTKQLREWARQGGLATRERHGLARQHAGRFGAHWRSVPSAWIA